MTDEQREEIDEMQNCITARLGETGTLAAVIAQMDYYMRRDIFAEIMRVYELEE